MPNESGMRKDGQGGLSGFVPQRARRATVKITEPIINLY